MNDTEKELVTRAIALAISYIASRDPQASDFVRVFETENAELINCLLTGKQIAHHVRTIGFAPMRETK